MCSELRYLPVTHTLADERTLLILCDLSYANSDAVEVAMVTATQTHNADIDHVHVLAFRFFVGNSRFYNKVVVLLLLCCCLLPFLLGLGLRGTNQSLQDFKLLMGGISSRVMF